MLISKFYKRIIIPMSTKCHVASCICFKTYMMIFCKILFFVSYRISAIDFKCNARDDNLLATLKLNALPISSSPPISFKKADSQSTNMSKVS